MSCRAKVHNRATASSRCKLPCLLGIGLVHIALAPLSWRSHFDVLPGKVRTLLRDFICRPRASVNGRRKSQQQPQTLPAISLLYLEAAEDFLKCSSAWCWLQVHQPIRRLRSPTLSCARPCPSVSNDGGHHLKASRTQEYRS